MTDNTIKYMNELKNQIEGFRVRFDAYTRGTSTQKDLVGMILVFGLELVNLNLIQEVVNKSLISEDSKNKCNKLINEYKKDYFSEIDRLTSENYAKSIQKSN